MRLCLGGLHPPLTGTLSRNWSQAGAFDEFEWGRVLRAIENGLRELGWVKGHNLSIEYRSRVWSPASRGGSPAQESRRRAHRVDRRRGVRVRRWLGDLSGVPARRDLRAPA